jgi:dinuclear metal center YbgI/SA1388 family protein
MTTVAQVAEFMQGFAPLELAADWDNVGLLLGDAASSAERIMTCLTVTPPSAAEAIEAGAGLIISHHPILFRGCKRLTAGHPEGKMLLDLARANVAVYSPHTAFDNTTGGINDLLADKLGLQKVRPLRRTGAARQCKVVVFVPESDLPKVSEAMFAAGAGHIGPYSQCSFRIPGTGTFFGSDASNPTLGQRGRREEVSEFRLEVICPESQADGVVAALRKVHSYEEPAYDVYPLRGDAIKGEGNASGMGRIGTLPKPMPLTKLARLAKQVLKAQAVQVVGEGSRTVECVAISCGAGGDFIGDAAKQRADVLLTGEARFHECLAAEGHGLALLLPGHYATERPGVEALAQMVGENFPHAKVWASQSESDPLRS